MSRILCRNNHERLSGYSICTSHSFPSSLSPSPYLCIAGVKAQLKALNAFLEVYLTPVWTHRIARCCIFRTYAYVVVCVVASIFIFMVAHTNQSRISYYDSRGSWFQALCRLNQETSTRITYNVGVVHEVKGVVVWALYMMRKNEDAVWTARARIRAAKYEQVCNSLHQVLYIHS